MSGKKLRRTQSMYSTPSPKKNFTKTDETDPWDIPRYESGEIIIKSPFSTPSPHSRKREKKKLRVKRDSILISTLKKLNTNQRFKKEKNPRRNSMSRLKKCHTMMIPRRKKIRMSCGSVDYDSCWEMFGLESPEKSHLRKVRRRLNKKHFVESQVRVNRLQVLSCGKIKIKKKKKKQKDKERKIRDYLTGTI